MEKEKLVKELEQRYRNLLETLPYIVVTINREGIVTSCSKAVLPITGYSRSEIVGKHFSKLKFFYAENIPELLKLFNSSVSGKKTKPFQVRVKDKNENEHFIDFYIGLIRKDRRVVEGQVLARDVTQQKEYEERLKRLNILLRTIRNVNQLITKEKDVNKLIKGVCYNLTKVRGYLSAWINLIDESGKIIKTDSSNLRKISEVLKEEVFLQGMAKALKQPEPVIVESSILTRKIIPLAKDYQGYDLEMMIIRLEHDKKIYGTLSVLSPQKFLSGKEEVSLFKEVAGDISSALYNMEMDKSRRQAEIMRLKSEKNYKILFDSINDGIAVYEVIYDKNNEPLDYIMRDVNPVFKEIFGVKQENIIGRKATEFHKTKVAPFINIYSGVAETGNPVKFETYFPSLDKYFNISVFSFQKGTFTTIYTDVTDCKKGERVKDAIYKISEAVHSTEDLNKLYYSIHHIVSSLMPAHNFYIALYDETTKRVKFPYYVDENYSGLTHSDREFGRGVTEYVFNMQKSLLAAPEVFERLEKEGRVKPFGKMPVSWLGVPLKVHNKTIGVMAVQSYTKGVIYTEEDKNVLQFVSAQAAMAIEKKRAEEERERLLTVEHGQRLRAETLTEITLSLASKTILTDVLDEILKQAKRLVPYTSANIALLEGNVLRNVRWQGYKRYGIKEYIANVVQPLDKYKVPGEAIKTKKPLIVSDTAKEPNWVPVEEFAWVKSHIAVPLLIHGNVFGMLRLDGDVPDKFTKKDAKKLEPLANAAAIAIENARLFDEAQKEIIERKAAKEKLQRSHKKLQASMQSIIYTIAKIAEMKDPYTAGHQRRVSQLAVAIAKEMGLPEDKIEGLRIASLMHDIGKINIPSEILTKPTKLTKLEYLLIQNHPQAGADILKNIEFPWPITKIILQHHEKINGSGYPQGLSGNDIMLEARIMCVADVVEAMSSHRPYRPALGIEKALEEIEKNKGILYDSEAVDACIELFKKKGFEFKD